MPGSVCGKQGVLRTLSAKRSQLLGSRAVELGTAGTLARLIASLFAKLTGFLSAEDLFGLFFTNVNPWLYLIGAVGSGLLIGLSGPWPPIHS